MKRYCLYSLLNVDSSYNWKHQGHKLAHHFILSKIFYHFQKHIAEVTPYIYSNFEKPHLSSRQQYKNFRFYLHLLQWKINNQFRSLIQILYAEKPKNPV
jgi:hypothetical protein